MGEKTFFSLLSGKILFAKLELKSLDQHLKYPELGQRK